MIITKNYRFAGVGIAVSAEETLLYTQERRLAPFAVKDAEPGCYQFSFEPVSRLPVPEGICIASMPNYRVYAQADGTWRYTGPKAENEEKAYMAAEYAGQSGRVYLLQKDYPGRIGTKTVLEAIAAEHLIARNLGFVFHCSYIDHEGKAILFTAPSETGKSTQAELWHKHRGAEIINGDRAAVRLVDGVLMAEGIPFAGSSEYCRNRSLPIEAIVYLGQAPETTIRRVFGREAFFKLWEGVSVNTWDKEDMELVSGLVTEAAKRVPVFHMPCTPDEAAVLTLEQALKS